MVKFAGSGLGVGVRAIQLAGLCVLLAGQIARSAPTPASEVAGQTWTEVVIDAADPAQEVTRNILALLTERLGELGVTTRFQTDVNPLETPPPDSLRLVIGQPHQHPRLLDLCRRHRLPLPNDIDPGPEGYRLVSVQEPTGPMLLAIVGDDRGLLYVVGEILRQSVRQPHGIWLPEQLDVRGVARFPMRGNITHQGVTITELTGSRKWTEAEHQRAIVEYALAGANTFELDLVGPDDATYRFIKSLGLNTLVVPVASAGQGPEAWRAVEAIGRGGYLCPSIPEARAALVDQHTARFQRMAAIDFVHWKSADGGGCECDRCQPYGQPFIELCEQLTEALHRVHPQTQAFVGNQKLDNASERAILDHFQRHPHTPLQGIVYGPGSNAMGWMPGRRQDHRLDLYRYARMGQIDGYLRELLQQLPANKQVLLFTDLTHWVYSQYGLMDHHLIADRDGQLPPAWDRWMYDQRPDPAMAQVYDRRTFHARPRAYHRIFQHVMRYTIGDVAYSEGHHDHLNQWLWQRLMWDPHQSVEDVVRSYGRYHFGPEAADLLADAIFLHEQNLMQPIADNPGIDRFMELMQQGWDAMSEPYRRDNYLWLQFAQKGAVDKLIQLRLRDQQRRQSRALEQLATALEQPPTSDRPLLEAIQAAATTLSRAFDCEESAQLEAQAHRWGEASDRIFGVRNEGLFNLEQDFVGLGWLSRQLQRGLALEGDHLRQHMERIVHYEDPGPGGFYDDAGDPERSPHLVVGWPFGDGVFSDSNRPSQRRMAFTTDQEQGVTFEYFDLDPQARYRVRMSLMRPRYRERFARWQTQTSQSIYADQFLLAERLELPEYEAEFFEFDIPAEATADGHLRLWFQKQAEIPQGPPSQVTVWRNTGGWGTLVSEVWLMRRP